MLGLRGGVEEINIKLLINYATRDPLTLYGYYTVHVLCTTELTEYPTGYQIMVSVSNSYYAPGQF